MNTRKWIYSIFTVLALIVIGVIVLLPKKEVPFTPIPVPIESITNTPPEPTEDSTVLFNEPLSKTLSRVSKKPFSISINPKNSPVSPERFTGYHTGVDFEALPDEQNIDVPIYAMCAGTLLSKKFGSGYGGVVSQNCMLNNEPVTVVYGHLQLLSITAKVGDSLAVGEKIGLLGKGYSAETDGERKHLHLGIHKGATVNLRGYVGTSAELKSWIDALLVIKKTNPYGN